MGRESKDKISYYTLEEAAALLDAPVWTVERCVKAGLMPGATFMQGAWRITERALSLFLRRKVEPLYSVEQVAGILAVSVDTAREYFKRMDVVKLGTAQSSPVRVTESELRRWINA